MSFKIDHIYDGIQERPEIHVYKNILAGSVPKVNQWEPVVVNLVEEIDSEIALGISTLLRKAEESGQPFVPFFIESPGGSVYGLMTIMESMRRCKIPIYTFTSGIAASCAACIFTAGTRRFMSQYARLLIHDVSVDFSGETSITSTNIKVEANEMRILNRNIFQIMAKNTGQPPNFFVDLVNSKRNNDIYVNAKQALKWKLATDIGFPSVSVSHKLSMELRFEPEYVETKTNTNTTTSRQICAKNQSENTSEKEKEKDFEEDGDEEEDEDEDDDGDEDDGDDGDEDEDEDDGDEDEDDGDEDEDEDDGDEDEDEDEDEDDDDDEDEDMENDDDGEDENKQSEKTTGKKHALIDYEDTDDENSDPSFEIYRDDDDDDDDSSIDTNEKPPKVTPASQPNKLVSQIITVNPTAPVKLLQQPKPITHSLAVTPVTPTQIPSQPNKNQQCKNARRNKKKRTK